MFTKDHLSIGFFAKRFFLGTITLILKRKVIIFWSYLELINSRNPNLTSP